MEKIAMYMTGQLFAERVPGGVKWFKEIIEGLNKRGFVVDLYSCDANDTFQRKGISGEALKAHSSIHVKFLPSALVISFKNRDILRMIKKRNIIKLSFSMYQLR